MFKCQECGRKFKTVKAAERASHNGCPGCGGVDIDVDVRVRHPMAEYPPPPQVTRDLTTMQHPTHDMDGGYYYSQPTPQDVADYNADQRAGRDYPNPQ